MPTLTVCVTVDWEGEHLQDVNLNAMEAFRRRFPDMPLTHFICPAYFTRRFATKPIAEQIERPLRKIDEIGVHVHCWQTLVDRAGVRPVLAPSWYIEGNGPGVPYGEGSVDYGHGVPVGAYTADEAARIVDTASTLLTEHLASPRATSFRCGGWMSADPVQHALRAAGIASDSSATDAALFWSMRETLRNEGVRLGEWLPALWGAALEEAPPYLANSLTHAAYPDGGTDVSQPRQVTVGAGRVLQVPDNGVLADYLGEAAIFQRLCNAWELARDGDRLHVCGFHQESASDTVEEPGTNLDNLTAALRRFLEWVGDRAPQVRFNTVAGFRDGRPGQPVTYQPPDASERERREQAAATAPRTASPGRRIWG